MKLLPMLVLALAALPPLSVVAQTDKAPIRHDCQAPAIPPQPMDRDTAASLQKGLDRYKACIQAFVDGQQAEGDRHRRAAREAIDEFNDFISTKVPKPAQ